MANSRKSRLLGQTDFITELGPSSASTDAPAPARYIEWVNAHLGFNPRSQQNSDALSGYVTDDLRRYSASLNTALVDHRLQMRLNEKIRTHIAGRDIDLVLVDPAEPGPLNRARLAVENKTIMTAHGKARWNRYGDLIAYSNHLHNHSLQAIAGAVVTINVNPNYFNPDPFAADVERNYGNMRKIVEDTVAIFVGIPPREKSDEPNDQPEGIAVIVVDYDGVNPATLVTDSRAPQPGDPVHYDSFAQRLARLYDSRFA